MGIPHTHTNRNTRRAYQRPGARTAFTHTVQKIDEFSLKTSWEYVQMSLNQRAYPRKTMNLLKKVVKRFNNDPGSALLTETARMCAVCKKDRDSIDFYERALRSDPDFVPALRNYAYLLKQHGKFEKAETLYARLFQIKGNEISAENVYDIADFYQQWGQRKNDPSKIALALGCFWRGCHENFSSVYKAGHRLNELEKYTGRRAEQADWLAAEKHLLSIKYQPTQQQTTEPTPAA